MLVPQNRLELSRGCPRGILSPLRLPIPPLRQLRLLSYNIIPHSSSGYVLGRALKVES